LLYYFLKFILNIFYRVFYRLSYRNLDRIPKGRPVILAPNHTNAFIDPTILGMLLPLKVRFFARGDVFKGKMARYFLDRLNISPMYRMQEGYSELKKNDKTFEECKQLLSANKCVLLFPEAICVQERRLRKLKKGLARILFMTEEEFDFKKEVLVVPVGLNYNHASKIRSKIFIDVGEPVSAKDYEERFKTDKVKAINEFTLALERKMRETMVVVEDPRNDELMAALEEMFLRPWASREKGSEGEKEFLASRALAEMINYYERVSPTRVMYLREKILPYRKELHGHKLRDHLLHTEAIEAMSTWSFMGDFLTAWFSTPIYWMGMFMNYPPYFLAQRYADKKVKHIEFHASVNANLSWMLWLLWYAMQLVAVGLIFRSWVLLGVYALLVPLTLWHAIAYYPMKRKIFGRWRLMRMVRKQKATVEKLIYTRYEIEAEVERMRKEMK
jgi:1-acyl-sn-glycerol-3-phosphate acyltransferase